MADEVEYLGRAVNAPDRPYVDILGGAKGSDRLEVIEKLSGLVDAVPIGVAMAYTFYKAQDLPVGKSLVEDDLVETAKKVLERAKRSGIDLELPVDHVVAPKLEPPSPTQTLD